MLQAQHPTAQAKGGGGRVCGALLGVDLSQQLLEWRLHCLWVLDLARVSSWDGTEPKPTRHIQATATISKPATASSSTTKPSAQPVTWASALTAAHATTNCIPLLATAAWAGDAKSSATAPITKPSAIQTPPLRGRVSLRTDPLRARCIDPVVSN